MIFILFRYCYDLWLVVCWDRYYGLYWNMMMDIDMGWVIVFICRGLVLWGGDWVFYCCFEMDELFWIGNGLVLG